MTTCQLIDFVEYVQSSEGVLNTITKLLKLRTIAHFRPIVSVKPF